MATANTKTSVAALPEGSSVLANLPALAQMLGGTTQTTNTNAGDITALQSVLGQLQGTDYNAMLQSIFQQAAGGIPQLQSRMSNALGARSGSNSAMAAALQKLLQDTTLAAQEKIAAQQLQNMQTQAQTGQAIAQATKGTQSTTTNKTNVGTAAGNLAKATALMTLLGQATKLSGANNLSDAIGKLTGLGTGATVTPTVAQPMAAAPITDTGGAGINAAGAGYSPAADSQAANLILQSLLPQAAPVAPATSGAVSFPTDTTGYYTPDASQVVAGDAYQPAMDIYNQGSNAGLGADFAQYEVQQPVDITLDEWWY